MLTGVVSVILVMSYCHFLFCAHAQFSFSVCYVPCAMKVGLPREEVQFNIAEMLHNGNKHWDFTAEKRYGSTFWQAGRV